jgi:sporulation protein YqfC
MAKHKMTFKEKMSDMLEIPKELILDIPKITLIGNKQLFIENYKGIIEYEENKVRIKTNEGLIKIAGANLFIKEITTDDLMVSGKINTIEFGE